MGPRVWGGDPDMPAVDRRDDWKPEPLRRFEVITGVGVRRRWAPDVKADIMMEALAPGAVVSQVARRHALRPGQLFDWLREARKAGAAFVPVLVDPPAPPETAPAKPKVRRRRGGDGLIELEIDGVAVRVGRGAEAKTVAAVIQALRGAR